VFSACKLKKLFLAKYCVVRAEHEFDFKLLQAKHITNGDQMEEGHAVTRFMFLTGSIFYS